MSGKVSTLTKFGTEEEIAWHTEATDEEVNFVLNQPVETGDGRSKWTWLRLENGDLMLGVWPQGDTYTIVTEEMNVGGRI